MKRLIAAVVLALVAAVANAETPTASSAPVVALERPAAVCPLEMARTGFECLVGWTDAKGQLVCTHWSRTRSMETGLDKFGK